LDFKKGRIWNQSGRKTISMLDPDLGGLNGYEPGTPPEIHNLGIHIMLSSYNAFG